MDIISLLSILLNLTIIASLGFKDIEHIMAMYGFIAKLYSVEDLDC